MAVAVASGLLEQAIQKHGVHRMIAYLDIIANSTQIRSDTSKYGHYLKVSVIATPVHGESPSVSPSSSPPQSTRKEKRNRTPLTAQVASSQQHQHGKVASPSPASPPTTPSIEQVLGTVYDDLWAALPAREAQLVLNKVFERYRRKPTQPTTSTRRRNQDTSNAPFRDTNKAKDTALHAGLDPLLANAHIAGNILDDPPGNQDFCNMEGATDERGRSTGAHDCVTSFTHGNTNENPPNLRCDHQTQTCAVPNRRMLTACFAEPGARYVVAS